MLPPLNHYEVEGPQTDCLCCLDLLGSRHSHGRQAATLSMFGRCGSCEESQASLVSFRPVNVYFFFRGKQHWIFVGYPWGVDHQQQCLLEREHVSMDFFKLVLVDRIVFLEGSK